MKLVAACASVCICNFQCELYLGPLIRTLYLQISILLASVKFLKFVHVQT